MKHFITTFLTILIISCNAQTTYFSIHFLQDTIIINQGQNAMFTLTGISYSGFSSSLFLSATAKPCNLNLTFTPSVLNSPYSSSTLLIGNTASVRPDTFEIIAKAENGTYSTYDSCVLIINYSDNIKWANFNPENSGLSYSSIRTVMQDKLNNDVWVLQNKLFKSSLSRFNGYSWETLSNSGDHFVSDMCGNVLWSATDSPIKGNISSIYIDSNKIWLGTSDSGIQCINRTDMSIIIDTVLHGVSNAVFTKITKDNSGNMWFAGRYSFLWKYDGTNWTNYYPGNSPIKNEVHTIATDKNNKTWIGTFSGGLVSYDGIFWTVYTTSNSSIPNNYVEKMVLDENGFPIIYGENVLYRFDGVNTEIISTNINAMPLQIDSQTIWYGSEYWGESLYSYGGTTGIIHPVNLGVPVIDFNTTSINDMMKDDFGNIWISTENGLVVYNKNGLQSIFDSPKSLFTPMISIPEKSFKNNVQDNFLYPNPSNGNMTFAMTTDQEIQLNLKFIDSRGILVKSWNITSVHGYQEQSFDLSQFPAGLYYFFISSSKFTRSQKLVLIK